MDAVQKITLSLPLYINQVPDGVEGESAPAAPSDTAETGAATSSPGDASEAAHSEVSYYLVISCLLQH